MKESLQQMEGSLNRLLSILKKNKDSIAPELLNTIYHDAYHDLQKKIKEQAESYVKAVTLSNLIINPNIPLDAQIQAINKVIEDSGMMKEISRCFFRYYDIPRANQLCLQLRQKIEAALWTFLSMETYWIIDVEHPETEPVLHNLLTHRTWKDGEWTPQEIDLSGKALIHDETTTTASNKGECNYIDEIKKGLSSGS